MTPRQLQAAREQLGMTQAELAQALHIGDGRTVRRWEAGKAAVPGPVAILINLWLEKSTNRERSSDD